MNRWLYRALVGLTLAITPISNSIAESVDPDLEEEAELLDLLAEQTEIATRSYLNSDYVPGMVTVLRGDDLARRGARTVWDALGFVPGVVPIIPSIGAPRVTVRGVGAVGPYRVEGYIKVLQNGIALNDDVNGLADAAMLMPLAQVERIEVIRGPGSALYGEYAMAGVVNIITRSDEQRVFLFGGSEQSYGGGAIVATGNDRFRLSLNLSQWRSSGADMEAGPDGLYTTGVAAIAESSYAPGPANEEIRGRYGVVQLTAGQFSLVGQWHEARLGDYFGVNHYLPPDSDRLVDTRQITSFEARQRLGRGHSRIELYAGERRYRLKKDGLFAGTALLFSGQEGDDVTVSLDYEERRRYYGVDWLLEQGAHRLLLGLQQADSRTLQDSQSYNFLVLPDGSIEIGDTWYNYGLSVVAGTTRHMTSLTLQDEYRVSDALSVTYGARYDHYSDTEANWSPRIAAVWRWDSQQTLKAQYSHAYRPSTFLEQSASAEGLPSVTMETVELGYAARTEHSYWRLSAAHSNVGHVVIQEVRVPSFVSGEKMEINSLELEGGVNLGADLSVTGSLARLWSDLSGKAGSIPGSSDWLARLGGQWRATAGLFANLEINHVSNFNREQADPRPAAKGFTTADLTLTQESRYGLTLRAGIANLFDADVRFPAFLVGGETAESYSLSYADDLPRPGRTWWIEVSQAF